MNAIKMTRNAKSIVSIDMKEDEEALPKPTAALEIKADPVANIATFSGVNLGEC